MFHTAITTAVLQISHRGKKAFRISTEVHFGNSPVEVQVVWIWSRSTPSAPNQSAPNALLDSLTSLPSIGNWAGRSSSSTTGPPVREATRELGLRALFELQRQRAQNTTVTGFIGGKEGSFTIEAFKDEPPLLNRLDQFSDAPPLKLNRAFQISHADQDGEPPLLNRVDQLSDEPPLKLNGVDRLLHAGQDYRFRLSYDDFLLRQGPYWHKALMCAIANNINLIGRESQYHYARVSLAIGGAKYQWILHAQVSQVSTSHAQVS